MRKRLTVNGHGRATHELADCSRPIVVEALEDGVEFREPGGMGNAITLTIRQWEEALAAIRVHEVPEPKTPGQVHFEAMDAEFDLCGKPWHTIRIDVQETHERVARRLGIKPEGE